MISYSVYKIIHYVGIFTVVGSLGAFLARVAVVDHGPGHKDPWRRNLVIGHGTGLEVVQGHADEHGNKADDAGLDTLVAVVRTDGRTDGLGGNGLLDQAGLTLPALTRQQPLLESGQERLVGQVGPGIVLPGRAHFMHQAHVAACQTRKARARSSR